MKNYLEAINWKTIERKHKNKNISKVINKVLDFVFRKINF